MSHVRDDPYEYKKNPLYAHREFGDFSAFYITITICTIFGLALIIVNAFFCWCSKHKDYWTDSNTGNRWIASIWTKTPYKSPPLDLIELEGLSQETRQVYETSQAEQQEYFQLQKRESEL